MPTWPATLPQEILQRGYAEGMGDNVLRSQVSAGPEKTRRRFTSAPRPLRGVMTLTKAQLDIFKSFFRGDIADGALSFDFPHPHYPSAIQVKFQTPPTWTNARGDNYNVNLDLRIQP